MKEKILKFLATCVAVAMAVFSYIQWFMGDDTVVIDAAEDAEVLAKNEGYEKIHHLDQGAVQLPLFILLSMKSKGSDELLVNAMQDYGFITKNSEANPEAMPIGMSTTQVGGMKYTTMNCAVCHTGKIRVDNKAYIIDGAANHFHTMAWAKHVKESIEATLHSDEELLDFLIRAIQKKTIVIKSGVTGEPYDAAKMERVKENVLKDDAGKMSLMSGQKSSVQPEDVAGMAAEELEEFVIAKALNAALDEAREVKSYELDAEEIFEEQKVRLEKYIDEDKKLFTAPLSSASGMNKTSGDKPHGALEDIVELVKLMKFQLEYGNNILGIVDRLGDFGPGRDDAWSILTKLLCDNKDHNGVLMYGQSSAGAPADALQLNKPAPVKVPNLFSISHYHRSKEFKPGVYHFHYDGNTNTMVERNLLQALAIGSVQYYDEAAGGEATEVKLPALMQAENYFSSLNIPNFSKNFPQYFDEKLAKKGEEVFHREIEINYTDRNGEKQTIRESCYSCHQTKPEGREFPIELIQTDPKRWAFFNEKNYRRNLVKLGEVAKTLTENTAKAQNFDIDSIPEEAKDRRWYVDQTGYYARTLEGVWASPPYLHNGSVRTIRDLLNPASERKNYYLGSRNYDVVNLGYMDDKEMDPNNTGKKVPAYFLQAEAYTDENGVEHPAINGGHEYGVDFSDEDKAALIEYLKTLGDS
ncbi:hypothetical protein ACFPK9_01850 [Rubritalea spongiae]|uniref:Cytochrome c domain-containing protein n=1 Tax=Rubritalea spongiae TaxID=430797 RepID=A0ABW5E6L5_9BACT